MTRALIAIGVNTYDHVNALGAAEHDATVMFNELIKPDVGAYEPAFSRLLLSPTLAEVRLAVEEVVLGGVQFDELTFFFAGHGMIQPVGFYMAMRDTRLDRATATAFSLSELFAQIAEASPAQTNVILDACFSGGLAADLSMLTRPETSGYVGSPAVTLLAMSARNQEANEYADGGVGTSALLECITGRALVREDVGSLELFDIAQVVIQRVRRPARFLWTSSATRAVVIDMTRDDLDRDPMLEPDDALEVKLRLGVMASAILDHAHILSTDTSLLALSEAGPVLRGYADDFQRLAAAMEVLERRSVVHSSRS